MNVSRCGWHPACLYTCSRLSFAYADIDVIGPRLSPRPALSLIPALRHLLRPLEARRNSFPAHTGSRRLVHITSSAGELTLPMATLERKVPPSEWDALFTDHRGAESLPALPQNPCVNVAPLKSNYARRGIVAAAGIMETALTAYSEVLGGLRNRGRVGVAGASSYRLLEAYTRSFYTATCGRPEKYMSP